MPTTHAAAKALRQTIKHRAKNVAEKAHVTKLLKQFGKVIAAKKVDDAATAVRAVGKALDKAVTHGVIKKNTAARLKSRAMKKFNALKKA